MGGESCSRKRKRRRTLLSDVCSDWGEGLHWEKEKQTEDQQSPKLKENGKD